VLHSGNSCQDGWNKLPLEGEEVGVFLGSLVCFQNLYIDFVLCVVYHFAEERRHAVAAFSTSYMGFTRSGFQSSGSP